MAPRSPLRLCSLVLLLACAGALGGCEHDRGSRALAMAPTPPPPPNPRVVAAQECWALIERDRRTLSIDRRADAAVKCIDDKLAAVEAARAAAQAAQTTQVASATQATQAGQGAQGTQAAPNAVRRP